MFLVYLLGVVLFFSFLANFAFRKIFKSFGWVDKPDGIKKLHKNDIPLSGGISFITSLIFAVLIFDFFAGAIIGISQLEAASRHSVTPEGFLDTHFEKRSDSVPYFKLRAAYYTKILNKHSIGIIPSYEFTMGDGFSGFNLSAVYFF